MPWEARLRTPSPRFWILALLAAALPACRQPKAPDNETSGAGSTYEIPAKPREALVGQWTIDARRLAEQPRLAAMTPEKRALALEMAENVTRSMSLDFSGDRYVLSMAGKTTEGAYSVSKQDGRSLTLATTGNDGAADQMELEFTDRGLIWHTGEGDTLPLTRKR